MPRRLLRALFVLGLLSLFIGGIVLVFSARDPHLRYTRTMEQPIVTVAVSPDQQVFAAADNAGGVQVWRVDTGALVAGFPPLPTQRVDPIARSSSGRIALQTTALAWNPDHTLLFVGRSDGALWIGDLATQQYRTPVTIFPPAYAMTLTMNGMEIDVVDSITSLAVSDDGQMLAIGGTLERVALRALMQPTTQIVGERPSVRGEGTCTHLLFRPGHQQVVAGLNNGAVVIWDSQTGRHLETIPSRNTSPVVGLRANTRGDLLFIAKRDRYLALWSLSDQRYLWEDSVAGLGEFTHVDFVPDRMEFLSIVYKDSFFSGLPSIGGRDDRIHQAPIQRSQHPLASLQGHQGAVRGLAISTDGTLLVSGGDDRRVQIWDLTAP